MLGKFKVLSSIIEEEKEQWQEIWDNSEHKEVFLSPEYAKAYNNSDEIAKCAVLIEENTTIMYTFIQRKIDIEYNDKTYYDLITPYGYGGAHYSGNKSIELEIQFNEEFEKWCKLNNIISEFVRFNLFNKNLINYNGIIEENNLNIVCDLQKEEEDIWKNFKHKVRKNIKKALNNDVIVQIDEEGDTLEQFVKIYYETMDRNNASSQYYFSKSYFQHIINKLKGNYIIVNAIKDSEIISTELVLMSSETIYSFLGGTKSEYFDIRPNDILKYKTILWAKEKGLKYYVLGGGYKKEDGIYKYKLAFNPNGIHTYKVGKKILNQNIYDILCNKKLEYNRKDKIDNNYFPLYRI